MLIEDTPVKQEEEANKDSGANKKSHSYVYVGSLLCNYNFYIGLPTFFQILDIKPYATPFRKAKTVVIKLTFPAALAQTSEKKSFWALVNRKITHRCWAGATFSPKGKT